MRYDRFTKKTEFDNYTIKCEDCKYKDECEGYDVDCEYYLLRELGRLEDKLENGTLIEMPCKVGDIIYYIKYDCGYADYCSECKHDYSGFGENCCDLGYEAYVDVLDFIKGNKICSKFKMKIEEQSFDLAFYVRHIDEFGISWFLTKAEAEAKLKELREV